MKEGSIFYEGVYFIAHNSAFAALALLTACILCHLPSVYGTFIFSLCSCSVLSIFLVL